MASKGPEAFRTISEVADELDLPQHVLRFWETRFTQIRPMKRGGGRRYYRPDDVDLLRAIRQLLYGEGYTIRGVQRILKEQGPRSVVEAARGSALVSDGADYDEGGVEPVSADDDVEPEGEDHSAEPVPDAPAFDPRDFRPSPSVQVRPNGSAAGASADLTEADKRLLQAALANLLELKRLLDHRRS